MAGFVEVYVEGNARAYLRASTILGVATSPGGGADTAATPEDPMSLILAGGQTLGGVYGLSPNMLLVTAAGIDAVAKDENRLVAVAYLDPESQAQLREKIAAIMERR